MKDELYLEKYDLAPDEFTFNFLNKTGKFYLDDTGNWRVKSNENLEILFDYNNPDNFTSPLFSEFPYKQGFDKKQCKTIAGFIIKDDEGYSYQFGYDRNAIEYTTNFWQMSKAERIESWHASCWYLTKITDKFGNDLFSLSYERGAYVIQIFNCFYSDVEEQNAHGILSSSNKCVMTNRQFPYTVSINSPVYLTKIKGLNGVFAEFYSKYVSDDMATEKLYNSLCRYYGSTDMLYTEFAKNVPQWEPTSYGTYPWGAFYYLNGSEDSEADKKDSIANFRYNPKNVDQNNLLSFSRIRQLKKISITTPAIHDYIGFRFYISNVNNRLKLDSLFIQNNAINYTASTGVRGIYRFLYNDFEKLPSDYLTTEVDHWGYYKGKAYFANRQLTDDDLNVVRNPNFTYTKIGSLREIQYPTGGTTILEYEPNEYGKRLSLDRQSMEDVFGIGGGMRIKSIKNFNTPSHNKLLVDRRFFYNIPNSTLSSGELFATPIYKWNDWKIKCENNNATYKINTLHTSSIVPLVNSAGVSLGYTYVTEEFRDLKDCNKCVEKHLYQFSNFSDLSSRDERFCLSFGYKDGITPYDEYSELDFKRGNLQAEKIYDNIGIRKSIGYKYRNDEFLSNNYVLSSNLQYVCNYSAQFLHYLGGVYKYYYPKFDIVEIQDTIYDKEGNMVMSTQRTYKKKDLKFLSFLPYKREIKLRLTEEESLNRGVLNESTFYHYGNFEINRGIDSILYKKMFCLKPLSRSLYRNGEKIGEYRTIYKGIYTHGNVILAPSMNVKINNQGESDTLVVYDYTDTGQLRFCREKGNIGKYYTWAVNDNYLLSESDNSYSFNVSDNDFFKEKVSEQTLNYRNRFGNNYKLYVYNPLFGPTMIIEPNNVTNYKYDTFGRLVEISDENKRIIKKYEYNIRK